MDIVHIIMVYVCKYKYPNIHSMNVYTHKCTQTLGNIQTLRKRKPVLCRKRTKPALDAAVLCTALLCNPERSIAKKLLKTRVHGYIVHSY